jgi:hypothetical protein
VKQRNNRWRNLRTLLALALLGPGWALAMTPTEEAAIDHLNRYIAQSDCLFARNGSIYGASKAAEHIATKYRAVKSRIDTAEQFIEYAASRSSISGQPYIVQCGVGQALSSADWLGRELARYRTAVRDGTNP